MQTDAAWPPGLVVSMRFGEESALEVAGVVTFLDGLRLVAEGGQVIGRVAGGVTAVVGLTEDEVREELSRRDLADVCIAAVNTPEQVALSGPVPALDRAEQTMRL